MFQSGLGLTIKTANSNSPWAYVPGRLIIGRIFASEIWGLITMIRNGRFPPTWFTEICRLFLMKRNLA